MNEESKLFGMSVRAYIALVLTMSVAAMCCLKIDVPPTLHDGWFLVLGFFFGQKVSNQQTGVNNGKDISNSN